MAGAHGRSLAVMAACMALASCSSMSLINPYVGGDFSSPLEADKTEYHGALAPTLERASRLQTQYHDAVGHQALLRNGLAVTLIPLTAGALFHGTTASAGSDFAPAVAMITSIGLGVGNFLQSTPRQRVYLSGVNAVGCAMLKSQPYLLSNADFTQLQTNNTALLTQLGAALSLLDRAESPEGTMRRELAALQSAITRGQTAANDAAELLAQIDGAAANLQTELTFIRVTVGQQITRTEPDLETLAGALTRLRTASAPATGALPPQEPPSAASSEAVTPESVSAATQNLNTQALFMRQVVDARRRMAAVAAAAPICASGIASGSTFSVQPNGAQIDLPRGAPVDFVVSGSMLTANVGHSLAGARTADIEVEVVRAQGSVTFRVTAKADAAAGSRTFTISDRNGEDVHTTTLVVPAE